jgi:S-adenosylmethionine:tRNA ribosyltransferase-isomerase
MKTSDFDYNLPKELIAQAPTYPRDSSRLMVVDRASSSIEHQKFIDIVDYLQKGDVLVWNNSKVFKARLFGKLHSGTGRNLEHHERDVEIFLVRPMENDGVWKVLAKPGKHVLPGMTIAFAEDFYCDVMVKEKNGTILVQFSYSDDEVRAKANQYGHIPIPPYVRDEPEQFESYQTVYAKTEGSVAAPTAGFHFTPAIIAQLKDMGVEFAEVTLHVGLGTFLPVKTEEVSEYEMHGEWVELSEENAEKINIAKAEGRRVIAVGTTTVRTLEGIAQFGTHMFPPGRGELKGGFSLKDELAHTETPSQPPPTRGRSHLSAYTGDINIFILPGFEFQIVDAMITNFHLPKSTLLMLVSAFAGDTSFMLSCYQEAVAEHYRFFSFGDSMLIQ